MKTIEFFLERWREYFPGAEVPIGFYYTGQVEETDLEGTVNEHRCLICNLNRVRAGHTFVYSAESEGCLGGKRYAGFSQTLRPNFEYFLSCGIPGEMEGERYKKSPELVRELLKESAPYKAPGKYLVFRRLDKFSKDERPAAVVFFAPPDVLSGLFTLANYDRADRFGVVAPMGAGCASIVRFPLEEPDSPRAKCVLGMFDVSARPCVPGRTLTFTAPLSRLLEMAGNMDESFLITKSWETVRKRIRKASTTA